ncbi:ribonuclease H, partial [Trifolium pratense]
MSWERLVCAKDERGLGFRDFKVFNMAMVAKQGWKIMTKPETMGAKIFKARFLAERTKMWMVRAPQPQVEEILVVPLISLVREDRLVWQEEQNEEYTMSKDSWNAGGLRTVISARLHKFNNLKDVIFDVCSKTPQQIGINGFGVKRGELQQNWVFKLFTCGMIGFLHKSSTITYQMMNRYNNITNGHHRDKVISKCNVDAGIHNDEGITSGGWCIRDEMEQFICVGTNRLRGVL